MILRPQVNISISLSVDTVDNVISNSIFSTGGFGATGTALVPVLTVGLCHVMMIGTAECHEHKHTPDPDIHILQSNANVSRVFA